MTKVIKGEFDKIKDVKVEDVWLTCDTQLEAFNNEVNRLSRIDDDLFKYEVEFANIQCDSKIDDDSEHEADDDMGYDPSDVAFTEWLGSKNFNYKTIDHYTMKALWIYWIKGDDEVELTDEEEISFSFKELNYLLEVDLDLLTKYIIGFKTYEYYKNDWIYEWNKDVPWVDEKPWTNTRDYESDEEYVAVKEDEYDDLTVTRKEACRAYQEIFQIMDEGWKEDTAYPCMHSPKTTEDKAQYSVSRETQYAVFKIWNEYNILENIKRGPYSKKSPIRQDTPILTKEEINNLYGPMFEEYFEKRPSEVSINFAAQSTLNNQDTPSYSVIVEDNEAPPLVSFFEEQIFLNPTDDSNELSKEDESAVFDENTLLSPYHTSMFDEAE
ncbi:hypothetical protein Tco_1327960 [Tanacetum coccineum]